MNKPTTPGYYWIQGLPEADWPHPFFKVKHNSGAGPAVIWGISLWGPEGEFPTWEYRTLGTPAEQFRREHPDAVWVPDSDRRQGLTMVAPIPDRPAQPSDTLTDQQTATLTALRDQIRSARWRWRNHWAYIDTATLPPIVDDFADDHQLNAREVLGAIAGPLLGFDDTHGAWWLDGWGLLPSWSLEQCAAELMRCAGRNTPVLVVIAPDDVARANAIAGLVRRARQLGGYRPATIWIGPWNPGKSCAEVPSPHALMLPRAMAVEVPASG